ncbi:MAG TPA: hypothetical protein VIQ01_03905, partial [Burkholderiales bacterium]
MRKILVIVAAALAGLAIVPQAQAHDDRVGVFVAGAVTGAIVGHVLTVDGHHHRHYDRGPRVVEHHYYESRRRPREVYHVYHERPRHYWK